MNLKYTQLEDIKESSELLNLELKNNNGKGNENRYQSLFINNPNPYVDGGSGIYVCKDGEKIVGKEHTISTKIRIKDVIYNASLSCDTVVDEEYRGQKIFINLLEYTTNELRSKDVSLFYGFPNNNSMPGFIKYLNWEKICDVYYYVKFLNYKSNDNFIKKVTKKILSLNTFILKTRVKIIKVTQFDHNLTNIIKGSHRNYSYIYKDVNYLNWRYSSNTFIKYDLFHIYDLNELVGYVVLSNMKGELKIIDFIILDDNILYFKGMINNLLAMYKDCFSISLLCTEDSWYKKVIKSSLFIENGKSSFCGNHLKDIPKTDWVVHYGDNDVN